MPRLLGFPTTRFRTRRSTALPCRTAGRRARGMHLAVGSSSYQAIKRQPTAGSVLGSSSRRVRKKGLDILRQSTARCFACRGICPPVATTAAARETRRSASRARHLTSAETGERWPPAPTASGAKRLHQAATRHRTRSAATDCLRSGGNKRQALPAATMLTSAPPKWQGSLRPRRPLLGPPHGWTGARA